MNAPKHWEIPVLDAHHREGTLRVVAARGNVILIAPPGGAWIVPPRSDEPLCDAIREARDAAEHPSGGEP